VRGNSPVDGFGRLVAQDSTDVPAYSNYDRDARISVRTIPKKQQQNSKKNTEFFFGYKIHTIVEVKTELLITITVEQATCNASYNALLSSVQCRSVSLL
jgi:hypothetical protein